MSSKVRGRIFQDSQFLFTEFDGLELEQIIVCESAETSEPILVFLKVENNNWHQYFLDAGIGFWESQGVPDTDDEAFNYVDRTIEFGLTGKRIRKIYCEPDQRNSKIVVEFADERKLVLRCVDPDKFDDERELLMIA